MIKKIFKIAFSLLWLSYFFSSCQQKQPPKQESQPVALAEDDAPKTAEEKPVANTTTHPQELFVLPQETGERGEPHYYEIYINRDTIGEQKLIGKIENRLPFRESITRSYTDVQPKRDVMHLALENDEIEIGGQFIQKDNSMTLPLRKDSIGEANSYMYVKFKNSEIPRLHSLSGSINFLEYTGLLGGDLKGKMVNENEYKLTFGGLYADATGMVKKYISGTLIINLPPEK